MRHVRLAAIAATLLAMLPATTAAAATRYAAADGGTIEPCAAVEACNFKTAVMGASNGDEIVVRSGNYTVTEQVVGPFLADLDIHGAAAGTAAPRVTFTGAGQLTFGTEGSELRDIHLESTHGGFVVQTAGTLRRVYSHTTGAGSACQARQVLDSVCWSQGGRAVYASAAQVSIRNVTAYGGTYGIDVVTSSAGASNTNVANTIARGTVADLRTSGSVDYPATLLVHHSNWVSKSLAAGAGNQIQEGTGNQSAPPLLAAPGTGDFHQTAASPTHDKGVATAGTDIDGDPRDIGASTDIGADESPVAPAATTLAATGVSATAATLHGAVDSGGAATGYRFEYAATPFLGLTAGVANLAAGAGLTQVATPLSGLAPATTYYFRVVATNGYGSALGAVRTFATPATGGGGDTEPPLLGSLALTRSRFAVSGAFTPVTAVVRGTTLSFRVSEAGTAAIAIQRARAGRRKAGRCVAPSRARAGARRCTRWGTSATLTRKLAAGRAAVPFSGRIGDAGLSRKLRPGRYRFRVTVADAAGNRSDAATIRFRIVRG